MRLNEITKGMSVYRMGETEWVASKVDKKPRVCGIWELKGRNVSKRRELSLSQKLLYGQVRW